MTNDITPTGPLADLMTGWTRLWNGDLDHAHAICSPSVRMHFGGRAIAPTGDAVRTPGDVARLIGDFRAPRPGLTYRLVEAHTTDDWGVCIWDADMNDLHVGGIDTFTFSGGRIAHVRSITAERPMSVDTDEAGDA